MLTRGQVAKRLGKSIATVRRMEGRELHPRRDERGVLRFNPSEVDRFVRQPLPILRGSRNGPARRSPWFEGELAERGESSMLQEEQQFLEDRILARTAETLRQEFTRLQRDEDERACRARELAEQQRKEAERAEVLGVQSALVSLLETCSDRELRRLFRDPELEETFEALLAGD